MDNFESFIKSNLSSMTEEDFLKNMTDTLNRIKKENEEKEAAEAAAKKEREAADEKMKTAAAAIKDNLHQYAIGYFMNKLEADKFIKGLDDDTLNELLSALLDGYVNFCDWQPTFAQADKVLREFVNRYFN